MIKSLEGCKMQHFFSNKGKHQFLLWQMNLKLDLV